MNRKNFRMKTFRKMSLKRKTKSRFFGFLKHRQRHKASFMSFVILYLLLNVETKLTHCRNLNTVHPKLLHYLAVKFIKTAPLERVLTEYGWEMHGIQPISFHI